MAEQKTKPEIHILDKNGKCVASYFKNKQAKDLFARHRCEGFRDKDGNEFTGLDLMTKGEFTILPPKPIVKLLAESVRETFADLRWLWHGGSYPRIIVKAKPNQRN